MSERHVIFGTGPVGLATMDELQAMGREVVLVNRSGRRPAGVPADVAIHAGDAADAAFARKASEGATHIYFAVNPPYTKWIELFPPLQDSVLAAAISADAKLIVMENLYGYGNTQGRPMTEDLPLQPHTRKGKTRAMMTEQLLAAHVAGKARVTMGRAADFFGPRVLNSALGDRMLYPILAGKAGDFIGNPDLPHTYTFMPDIGKALVTLGQRDEALGRAWHIPSPPTLTTREIASLFGELLGREVKVSPMPKLMLNGLAPFMPILREVKEMVYQFEQPFYMDHSKYAAAFGDHSTPMREAVAATLAWYQANPPMQ